MKIAIENNEVRAMIDTYGGELQSLQRLHYDIEYLWQGNPQTYQRKAINIFPYIARLTNGAYYLDGNLYHMQPLGFIADIEMQYSQPGKDKVVFTFAANADTLKMYPRRFLYTLEYSLNENTIIITYKIQNLDEQKMYFGIGGHPGFNIPIEKGISFEDYYLEFKDICKPFRVGMSDDCYVSGDDKQFTLENDNILRLNHRLFDDDAIILSEMSREVTLKSDRGNRAVTVKYQDMNYLGLWHWPRSESAYICIEPWSSVPSRQGVVEQLEMQRNLIGLEPGAAYLNTWSIALW